MPDFGSGMSAEHRLGLFQIDAQRAEAVHGAPLAIALSRTESRGLPQRPHLDIPKREARELLNASRGAR